MDIILNQNYEITNLVSLTGRFSNAEFEKALSDMMNANKKHASNGESIITTTRSLEVIHDEQIMDVELLLPVDSHLSVEHPYEFKSRLKITNALYTKITDIIHLQDKLNLVNQYMLDNRLIPVTSAYLVQTKQDNKPCIEVYIGINPNIL